MANPERGEFSLKVGDRRYTLRLTTNACAELEDLTNGKTIDAVVLGAQHGSVKSIRLLLWAALREHHPDIATDDPDSVKAIGVLVDQAGGFEGLLQQVNEFIQLNVNPEPERQSAGKGGESPDPPDAQALAGVGSSSTPVS